MKKSLIYILAVAAGLFSCDPYKELHDSTKKELDAQRDNDAIPMALTISEDDTVFTSVESAQSGIPAILDDTYRANSYSNGKLVEVTYSVGTLVDAPAFNEPHYVSQDEYKANDGEVCFSTKKWSKTDLDETLDVITFTADDFAVTGDTYNNFPHWEDEAGEYPEGTEVDNVINAKINAILNANHSENAVDGAKVTVEYAFYASDKTRPDIKRTFVFESNSNCYYAFKSEDDATAAMPNVLATAYPDSKIDFLIMTSYKVFDNYVDGISEDELTSSTVHKAFIFSEEENDDVTETKFVEYTGSPMLYMLYSEDYDAMGAPGKYNNFSSSVLPENYLPQFAASKLTYAQVGDEVQFLYKYYAGGDLGTIVQSMTFTKSDAWLQTAPILNTQGMDKFKYAYSEESNTGLWKVSLAVVVTLQPADYALTGDDQYGNFGYYDNKAGEYPEGTPVDNILDAKISHILTENYPELNVADQEVTVFYQYYDNGTNTVSGNYIYNASKQVWERQ